MSHDDPPDPAISAHLQGLMDDIARRLRPVCDGMPEAEFQSLVERMARTQYKYEMRPLDEGGGRRAAGDSPPPARPA